MRKLDLLSTNKENVFLHMHHTGGPPPYQPQAFRQFVSKWNSRNVVKWIEGLGDQVRPWLGPLRANIRSGEHLLIVDDDYLQRIGITSLGPRKVITQGIQLLSHFCEEMQNENLQLIAMRVLTSCQYVSRELLDGQRARERAVTRAQVVAILNNISSAISNLTEQVKKLIFWLDRSPFDEMPQYIEMRNHIASLIGDLLQMVNVTPRKLFNSINDIVKKSNELSAQSEFFVRVSDDPLILYTAFIEKVVMRRHDVNTPWGINLLSSYRGVHIVSEVKVGSPADLCGKIDAGDEIMVINWETVIGWDLSGVAERIGDVQRGTELHLVLKKRPREATIPLLIKEREAAKHSKQVRPLAKTVPGSQLSKMTTDESKLLPEVEGGHPINRRRSSNFKVHLEKLLDKNSRPSVRLRRRRASVCGGSPPPKLREERERNQPPHHLQFDLVALIGPNGLKEVPRVVRRARTMRHQPDGYVRSFIDNQVIRQVDDDVTDEQLPFNTKCPSEFATVAVVASSEITSLGIPPAKLSDPEWSAPFRETTEYRYRSPLGDSNLSAFSLDSPGVRKMTSSIEDAFGWGSMGVVASPSSSSIQSTNSPHPFSSNSRLMSTSVIENSSSFEFSAPPTPDTPCTLLTGKTFEGWVRRRKTGMELKDANTNKWPKCWMALRGPYLYLYSTQFSKKAELTISVIQCTVTDATDLKTSKKFVFRLSRGQLSYYFSCYNHNDMKAWMHKIIVASEIHSHGTGRVMSKSVSCMRSDSESIGDPLSPQIDSPSDPISPAHHTFPRNAHLCRQRGSIATSPLQK